MAKYKVEVGGFVTVLRQRTLTVYAANESEAKAKAIDKFIDIQSESGDPETPEVDSVELM